MNNIINNKITKIIICLIIMMSVFSCNEEWKDEQYEQYIAFKAPLNSKGISPIYVRYKPSGIVEYQLPVIVSGSKDNDKDIDVRIAVDPDTLNSLNIERFSQLDYLYYTLLEQKFYSFPDRITIPAGQNVVLLPINFTLADIDLTDKWVLPLTIQDDPSYHPNPMRHYKRALLRVYPFNNFSGDYSATALTMRIKGAGDTPLVVATKTAYVVDENTVFFYAGPVDEDRVDRKHYKIYVHFKDEYIDEEPGENDIDKIRYKEVELSSDNEDFINFSVTGTPRYRVEETMDEVFPYLEIRTTIIYLEYEFTDYTYSPGYEINYIVEGSLTMQRRVNTQIPDEDQAIQW